ncbi:PilZ domain-containing protein [Bacteriovoracaceae bacterium]|nr:PilZ domain-containing protein [Bacteriovoracaceae bacterium]
MKLGQRAKTMGHLNLIKNDGMQQEKRIFPRFPYCFLTFKGLNIERSNIFEVRDISYSGMQLGLRDGVHNYKSGDSIKGMLHWLGHELNIEGKVRWIAPLRLGVSFVEEQEHAHSVRNFLSVKNFVKGLRPLHREEFGLDLPRNLQYWLRADGPIEVFVWRYRNGEFNRFQLIMLNNFVEWEDGRGVRTGVCLSKRDIETPLVDEGEFLFEFDSGVDFEKINLSREFISHIPNNLLPSDITAFLMRKLED